MRLGCRHWSVVVRSLSLCNFVSCSASQKPRVARAMDLLGLAPRMVYGCGLCLYTAGLVVWVSRRRASLVSTTSIVGTGLLLFVAAVICSAYSLSWPDSRHIFSSSLSKKSSLMFSRAWVCSKNSLALNMLLQGFSLPRRVSEVSGFSGAICS